MNGLDHTRIKTMRAEEHLKRLQKEVSMFLESDPITITEQDDAEKGVHIRRFEAIIPQEIPLLAGELAYNLRSGLSQLAWQLALLSGREPTRDTDFPIHIDRSERSEKRFRRVTRDIPCEAIETIKSLQPYNRGDDFREHPIWGLSMLCNLDKHATLPVNSAEIRVNTRHPPSVRVETLSVDDCPELHITPLAAKYDVNVEISLPHLIFGRPIDELGPPFEITLFAIEEMCEFVRDEVIPRFEVFF